VSTDGSEEEGGGQEGRQQEVVQKEISIITELWGS
jgi:hypothetical protein